MNELIKAAEELLPCPFCGYELPLDEGLCKADDGINPETGEREHPSQVCCSNCGAGVVGGNTDGEAIDAWNTRQSLAQPEADAVFKPESDYWKGTYPDGMSNENINNELHDFKHIIEQISEVYMHISGNQISKAMTNAEGLKKCFDNHVEDIVKEAIEEALEDHPGTIKRLGDDKVSKAVAFLNNQIEWLEMCESSKLDEEEREIHLEELGNLMLCKKLIQDKMMKGSE